MSSNFKPPPRPEANQNAQSSGQKGETPPKDYDAEDPAMSLFSALEAAKVQNNRTRNQFEGQSAQGALSVTPHIWGTIGVGCAIFFLIWGVQKILNRPSSVTAETASSSQMHTAASKPGTQPAASADDQAKAVAKPATAPNQPAVVKTTTAASNKITTPAAPKFGGIHLSPPKIISNAPRKDDSREAEELREREARERDLRYREALEKESRERDNAEREAHNRDARGQDLHDRYPADSQNPRYGRDAQDRDYRDDRGDPAAGRQFRDRVDDSSGNSSPNE